jgi:hypothetical protein
MDSTTTSKTEAEQAIAPPEVPAVSVYCILWAGRFKGLHIVHDGKGVHETMDDEPSIIYPMPKHLLQPKLDFEDV